MKGGLFIFKVRNYYSFFGGFDVVGEFGALDDLATCIVVCVIVLPSNSVEIEMVYSVFSSKPSNRQLYLYIEAKASPNSSCVISERLKIQINSIISNLGLFSRCAPFKQRSFQTALL